MSDLIKSPYIERTVLFEGAYYTEGPVRDQFGALYFTDLTGGAIWKIPMSGMFPEIWATSVCPNGQAITSEGHLLVCDSKEHAVKRFDTNGRFVAYEIKATCGGIPVHVPNDIIVDRGGGFYFTDSIRESGRVFYKSSAGECYEIAEGFDYPNGLVLSADERHLFVAESYRNRILRLTLDGPGRLLDWEVWCDLPRNSSGVAEANLPDGLAMDELGQLWVAHYGMGSIQVIGADGELLKSIPTGLPLTSNVCLIDSTTIMVTGGISEPGPGVVVMIAGIDR